MSYHPWRQFLRQRSSVGLSGAFTAAGGLVYANRAQAPPHHWHNHDLFSQAQNARVSQVAPWQANNQGVIQIPNAGLPGEVLQAVENYAAFLQSLLGQVIAPSAAGTVIYDPILDQIVYGASGVAFNRPRQELVNQRLDQFAHFAGGTLVPGRGPDECAEVHALNWALFLGCQEEDLHVWTFRVNDMRPLPRCANCQITLPWGDYAKIWTC